MSGALRLDYDGRWVEVDLDDLDTWAETTAAARWADTDEPPVPGQVDALRAGLVHVGESMLESEVVMGFLLVPDPAEGVVAAVALRAFPAERGLTLNEVERDVLAPPEAQLGTPDVSRVETPAGTAVRIVQRYAEPVDPQTERVSEQVFYGWLLDEHGLVITVTTAFGDLVAAEAWRPAVDELARTFTVEA